MCQLLVSIKIPYVKFKCVSEQHFQILYACFFECPGLNYNFKLIHEKQFYSYNDYIGIKYTYL